MKSFRLSGAILILLLFYLNGLGQKSIRDSSIVLTNMGLVYNGSGTGGDLADRFGFTNQIGLEVGLKFANNFYLNSGVRFIVGRDVRERVAENVTEEIGSPETGYSTMSLGADGRYYQVRFWQRGYTIPLTVGKIFHVVKRHNPNSGLFVEAGGQFIQHKIKLDVVGGNVPQLANEYLPGYDRLTNGLGLVQAVGYRLYSNNKLINFHFGLEASQNFTASRRDYNYDLGYKDSRKRVDLLFGFRVAWIIPIYQDAANAGNY